MGSHVFRMTLQLPSKLPPRRIRIAQSRIQPTGSETNGDSIRVIPTLSLGFSVLVNWEITSQQATDFTNRLSRSQV